MKTIREEAREIPVLAEADVLVVGGGPAGIGAALASGRTGAETVLVERFGCLGGLQAQCYQASFSFVDPEIHGGIVQDILTRLEEGGATPRLADMPAPNETGRFQKLVASRVGKEDVPRRLFEPAGYWWQWGRRFDPEYYKYLLDNMMQEAGVRLLYHAFAAGAIREGNSLKGVIIESKEGRRAVLGKVVIDTTGEGDIAWKSGAPVMGEEGVPTGPRKGNHGGMLNAFYIGGVDIGKFMAFRQENPAEWGGMYCGRQLIRQAKQEGYHLRDQGVILVPDPGGRVWTMYAAYGVGQAHGWWTEELTKAEIELRKQMWDLHRLLKERVPGFESSYVEKTPVIPLSSDTHRMIGDYVLTIGDMREGKAFHDSVGINNMPPDLFETLGQFSYDILPHDIPYRCLVSNEVENLMAAGTTMSSGGLAVTGLRYCTPSVIQGQVAGTAAALAAKNGVSPKKVDIKLLQDALREQGAYVSVKDLSEEVLAPYRAIQEAALSGQQPGLYEEIAKY